MNDVFKAIADPTRREILSLVAQQPLNINSVSSNFKISRAAVYKHMRVLTQSGLVAITKKGRERYCEAKPEKLEVVSGWIEQYRKMWESRLDALEEYLNKLQTKG